jgi:ABC-type proline/glycine betaine transport system permease subunit
MAKIETTGASAGLDVVEDIARALGKTPAQMLTRLRTPRDD